MKLILALLLSTSLWASVDTKEDVIKTLSNLEGCFKVQYQFVEDGVHDKTYRPIFEYIRSKQTNSDEVVWEHIGQYPTYDQNGDLQRDDQGNPVYFVQYHWREHWEHVNDNVWKTVVYGPYNDFRYECEGKWIKGQFHCHADAVKPRRHMKRNYDYLARTNNLQVNSKRWIHAQRNKMMMNDGSIFSTEMGWNTYVKAADAECAPAINSNAQPLPRP